MSTEVNFIKGTYEKVKKEPIKDGQILITTDTGRMFVDVDGETRKQIGGGGASSWNDLKDKPFDEETVVVNEPLNITWDGNTEGLVIVADGLFKVSDLVLTDEQIKTATVTLSNGNAIYIGDIWENMVSNEMVAEDCVMFPEAAMVFVRKDNIEIKGLTFTQKGIYFMSYNGVYITSFTTTEPVEQIKTVVKKISGKYVEGMGYVEKLVVLPNHTLVNGVDNGINGVDFELPDFELKKDEDYILCLNGTDYLVTAEYEGQGMNAISLKIDGEEVINISTWRSGATCRVYYGSNVSTISICEAAETIHPIDPKYLPSGGSVRPEEVTTIVKEQFPGGVGYSEATETEIYRCEEIDPYNWSYGVYLDPIPPLKLGHRYRCEVDGTVYEGVAQIIDDFTRVILDENDTDSMQLISDGTETNFASGLQRPQSTLVVTEIDWKITTISKDFIPDGLGWDRVGEETVVVNEPLNITWDGNIEGRPYTYDYRERKVVKISDQVLSDEQIKLVTFTLRWDDGSDETISVKDYWDEFVDEGFVTDDVVGEGSVFFVRKANAIMFDEMTFPEAGIYSTTEENDGVVVTYIASLTTTEPIEQTKTVVKKIDTKYLPETGGGGTLHWKDIEDKPFGETVETVKITYDGDTTGLESVPFEGLGSYYKISDIVPRKEELIGGTFFIPDAPDVINIDKITVENLIDITGGYCIGTEFCVVINEYNSSDLYGCKFTSNGVWIPIADEEPIQSCELKYTSETIQTIDPKYLPSGGGGASSWNDIEGKPFGEIIIEWDGSTEGRDVIEYTHYTVPTKFYKVSDTILTADELLGANTYSESGKESVIIDKSIVDKGGFIYLERESSMIIVYDKTATIDGEFITFPSTGTYFAIDVNDNYISKFERVIVIPFKYRASAGRLVAMNGMLMFQNNATNAVEDFSLQSLQNYMSMGNAIYIMNMTTMAYELVSKIEMASDMSYAKLIVYDVQSDGTITTKEYYTSEYTTS